MDLKDLKLNDLIKIALAVTITAALTFSLTVSINNTNNTTIINNYQEITKKLEQQDQKLDTIQKVSDDIQGNTTQVESNINKTLTISKEILRQVD